MVPSNRIALVIPALNEEEALRALLAEIPSGLVDWIIVVDNGSTDDTAAVARMAGAVVVQEPLRGYGRACWKGFATAVQLGAEIVAFMDGDGSDDPGDLSRLLAPIVAGNADLIMGSRVSQRAVPGAVPPQARLGNWLVSRFINRRYGTHLSDIGSFRALKCSALEALGMCEMTFGWPVEMLVKAARARYRIEEVPLHYRRRSHGRSKVAGTFTGSLKAACAMLSVTWRYAGAK
ncbi:MAG: glycosyltransferase family 2 protein [Ktedonobacteraceae bacterium]|nr:glycosyltransferase family 2 protein [Ktedonobacteraceae bacterium]MBO0794533.1 glycosyltransferase family 2 protein [Ktedonobacteraceae bacterium]